MHFYIESNYKYDQDNGSFYVPKYCDQNCMASFDMLTLFVYIGRLYGVEPPQLPILSSLAVQGMACQSSLL